MQTYSIRNEGTNLIKEMKSLNRKSNNGVQYGIGSKKTTVTSSVPQYTTINSAVSNKSAKKSTSSQLTKTTSQFYYPVNVPIHLSDAKINQLSAKVQASNSKRVISPSPNGLNTSTLSMDKKGLNTSTRASRQTTAEIIKTKLVNSSQLVDQRSVERSVSGDRKITPVPSTQLELNNQSPRSNSNNNSQILSTNVETIKSESGGQMKKNSTLGALNTPGSASESKLIFQVKLEHIRQVSNPQDEKKATTFLPSLPIVGAGKKSRSLINSGRNSPRQNSPSPHMNFEFCKVTNEEITKKLSSKQLREPSPNTGSAPRSLLFKTYSKEIMTAEKTNEIIKAPLTAKSKSNISISVPKTNLYQTSRPSGLLKPNATTNKLPVNKDSDRDKSPQISPPKKISTTPQNKSAINFASKTKLSNTAVKKEPKQEPVSEKKAQFTHLLSDEERYLYGDRFLTEYHKTDFLGRGGFALVWLGTSKNTGKKVAVKQISKSSNDESQKKELHYGQLLFEEGGEIREKYQNYAGIHHLARMIDYKSTKHDHWHVFELGGTTLSKLLFDIKGEFYKGERIYGVRHLDLLKQFRKDNRSLKSFVKQLAEALILLSDESIVHCDLKPDNILIDINSPVEGKHYNMKIIDFGSAYNWKGPGNIGMATPEYMPPEFLHTLCSNQGNNTIAYLAGMSHPWSIDVWSLGAILLEIITGVPLWLSLKCKVELQGKEQIKIGLFAIKGRTYDKIFLKQRSVMENFSEIMGEYLQDWNEPELLYDLLVKLLKWDPSQRISPQEILKHPYLASLNQDINTN